MHQLLFLLSKWAVNVQRRLQQRCNNQQTEKDFGIDYEVRRDRPHPLCGCRVELVGPYVLLDT